MFCKNCGTKLNEGAAFCANCGTPVKTEQPVKEEKVVETPVVEENVVETPVKDTVVEETVAEQPTVEAPVAEAKEEFYTPDFEKTKKKLNFKKLVLPAIALVVALAIVILNFGTVVGFGIKTFGSGKAYLDFVQKETAKDIASSISDIYTNALLKNFDEDRMAATYNIGFTLDEDVAELLSSEMNVELGDKLDWINDLKLIYDFNFNDKKALGDIKLNISKKDIVSINFVEDFAKGNVYLAIPELCKDYLKVDLEETADFDSAEFANAYDLIFEVKEALPEGKQLEKLIRKYVGIAFDQIEDVTKSSDTLSIGGIDQKCTVLEYKVSEKDALKICEAVLEEALEDKEIKKIIEDIEDVLKDSDSVDFDEDLYELFEEGIDDLLDELDDVDTDSSNKIKIAQYVNSKHEVIGTKVKADGETLLYSATAQKGSEFASKVEIGEFEMKANGTNKKDIINGKYKISIDGEKICEIAVKDFDEKKAKEGYLNGNFRFTLSEDLIDELPREISSIISILEPTIEVDYNMTDDTSKLSINLLKDNKKVLFGITVDASIKESSKVSVPSKSIDVTDEEEATAYLKSISTDGIIESLRGTSVPSEFVDGLETIFESFTAMLDGSMYEDAYVTSNGTIYGDYYY